MIVDLGLFTIANGGTASSSLDFTRWRSQAEAMRIIGPGTLTGTVKLQFSLDGSTNWTDVQSAGADITIPADGTVRVNDIGRGYYRLLSSSAEGAQRIFTVQGFDDDGM